MKILLTGGSGDLAKVLTPPLLQQNNHVVRMDIVQPTDHFGGQFVHGSILDRELLRQLTQDNFDCIVHIAAWHGFHEFTKGKTVDEFWDLNVTGTYNVLQAADENHIKNIVNISSESVSDQYGVYGSSKLFAEHLADIYVQRHHMNIISLRMGAFIPYWNKYVYPNNAFIEWAKWYSKGAVHIEDAAQAVLKSIALLHKDTLQTHTILDIDGAYDYTAEDLDAWDSDGPGSTFNKYYSPYFSVIQHHDLDLTVKPNIRDISKAVQLIGYQPTYGLGNLLMELQEYKGHVPPNIYT